MEYLRRYGENGVWNNGWRGDENFKDFDDIYQSIQTYSDITWSKD
jgi:hypothetical protein